MARLHSVNSRKYSENVTQEYCMNNEENRLLSFNEWPFTEDCACTPEKMAEAGFYHCPTDNEPDLVRCFVCRKELDGWYPTDIPWKEHVKLSRRCPFVVLKKPQKDLTLKEFLKLEADRQVIYLKEIGGIILDEMKKQNREQREKMLANKNSLH